MSTNTMLYVGVAISLGGNILISVALNIQKYSHNQNELAEVKRSYVQRPLWWVGLIVILLGEIGNFLGYAFAPASVIAPLGQMVLVTNALIAWIVLKEKFRLQDFFGIVLALGGAIVVVVFSASSKPVFSVSELLDALKDTKFIVYLVVTVVLCIVLMIVSWKLKHKYLILDMIILGIYGGYTVISTKAIASFVTQGIAEMFKQWIFYFMVVVLVSTGAMQIRYLQRALESHDATEVVPIQYTLFTIFAVTASGVLYDDFSSMAPMNIGLFVLGIILIFAGVYLITHGRITPTKKAIEGDIEAQPENAHIKAEIIPQEDHDENENETENDNENDNGGNENDNDDNVGFEHDETKLIAK